MLLVLVATVHIILDTNPRPGSTVLSYQVLSTTSRYYDDTQKTVTM
jgi:hypothetical protein